MHLNIAVLCRLCSYCTGVKKYRKNQRFIFKICAKLVPFFKTFSFDFFLLFFLLLKLKFFVKILNLKDEKQSKNFLKRIEMKFFVQIGIFLVFGAFGIDAQLNLLESLTQKGFAKKIYPQLHSEFHSKFSEGKIFLPFP